MIGRLRPRLNALSIILGLRELVWVNFEVKEGKSRVDIHFLRFWLFSGFG
jgi:hypothetical protein